MDKSAPGSANHIRENGWHPRGAPAIVAISVMLATFMEVLDSTVVNVSLPHIAGNMSATVDESTWVVTSYLVSNAIVLPATGWLSMVFGRKRYYMFSVAAFAISSLLCGLAPSLLWLVIFRVIQGLCGGAMQPISQAIMLETFPIRRRGVGMAIFGVGVIFAPIIGPTLGGWITDNYSWRWIFYLNIPVSILSLMMTSMFVVDPPYLKRGVTKIDYMGLGLLAIGIGTLQIVLDNGQKHDWFATSWITQLAIISVVGIIALLWWERRAEHPIIDLSVFRARNFAPASMLIFTLGVALYGSLVLLPVFLQTLLGYSAMQSGLAMSPGGIGTLVCMPFVGYMVGRKDARKMIAFGLGMLAASMFMMARYNLNISFMDAVYPRIVMGIGLAFLFVPLATVGFAFMPPEKMGSATGLFNLMRNIGGSFGIAAVTTILARRAQFHYVRLSGDVSLYDPYFREGMREFISTLTSAGQTALAAQKQAVGLLYTNVQRQAGVMSFIDVFWLMGVVMILMIPLVSIMRRPPRHAHGETTEGMH